MHGFLLGDLGNLLINEILLVNAKNNNSIYIDELESFLHEHIHDDDGCLLHQVLISIFIFVDDVVLLALSPEGLQR